MGEAFLVKENNKKKIFNNFNNRSADAKVLVISREPPESLVKHFKTHTHILWLTNTENNESERIRPQELEQFSYIIERFIKSNRKSAILIMGVEFLISYTSFQQTIHLIQTIRDIVIVNDCTLIVNIGEGTLEAKEENLMKMELQMIHIK